MSLDQTFIADATDAADAAYSPDGEVTAFDVASTFLHHALKVWAREQGLAGETLSGVVNDVMQYATTTINEVRFGRGGA